VPPPDRWRWVDIREVTVGDDGHAVARPDVLIRQGGGVAAAHDDGVRQRAGDRSAPPVQPRVVRLERVEVVHRPNQAQARPPGQHERRHRARNRSHRTAGSAWAENRCSHLQPVAARHPDAAVLPPHPARIEVPPRLEDDAERRERLGRQAAEGVGALVAQQQATLLPEEDAPRRDTARPRPVCRAGGPQQVRR
jgi:hypothetical protein